MIKSLRMRMFWGATLVAVTVLAILGVCIDQAVRGIIRDDFDSSLMQKARALASMVEQQGADVHFDYQRSQFREFEPAAHPAYFEIWLDGKIFKQSASTAGGVHLTGGDLNATSAGESFILADGLRGRRIYWHFQPFVEAPESPGAVPIEYPRPAGLVVIAQNTVDLDRTLDQVRMLISAMCAGASLLVGGVLLLVARHTMRPVQRLATQLELIHSADQATAIRVPGLPSELVPMVDRLNDMLARLADAFDRERRFTADVAHELRTPLAGLLLTLEVCQSRLREPAAYQASIGQCVAILRQMEGLVERLLLLSRAEGGQLEAKRAPVNLEALALECWMNLKPRAAERDLTLMVDTNEGHAVLADAQLLQIVVKNLLDNAVSYATPGTRVKIGVRRENGRVHAQVSSQGHGLQADDLRRVFDRFWRKDKARSREGLHVGLGLGLCRRLLDLQQGDLEISLQGELFVAQISLPAADSTAALPIPEPAVE